MIEHGRVRITRRGIRHGVFGQLAGLWIELANRGLKVARVPDVTVTVGN